MSSSHYAKTLLKAAYEHQISADAIEIERILKKFTIVPQKQSGMREQRAGQAIDFTPAEEEVITLDAFLQNVVGVVLDETTEPGVLRLYTRDEIRLIGKKILEAQNPVLSRVLAWPNLSQNILDAIFTGPVVLPYAETYFASVVDKGIDWTRTLVKALRDPVHFQLVQRAKQVGARLPMEELQNVTDAVMNYINTHATTLLSPPTDFRQFALSSSADKIITAGLYNVFLSLPSTVQNELASRAAKFRLPHQSYFIPSQNRAASMMRILLANADYRRELTPENISSMLLYASKNGDESLFLVFNDAGLVTVASVQEFLSPILSMAAERGFARIVNLVLRLFPPQSADTLHQLLLRAISSLANETDVLQVVRLLVETFGANPANLDNQLLVRAVAAQNMEIVRYLLTLRTVNVNARNTVVLETATRSNNEELVNLLLERGADVNANDGKPLEIAVRQAVSPDVASRNKDLPRVFVRIAKMLIDAGAQPTAITNIIDRARTIAILRDELRIVVNSPIKRVKARERRLR